MNYYMYLYFFHFSLQLFIEEAFFAAHAPRRDRFPLRLILVLALYFGAGYGFVELFRILPGNAYALSILHYVLLFCISLLMLRFCFRLGFKEALFIGTAGYAVQHVTYALSTILRDSIRQLFGADAIPEAVNEAVLAILIYALSGLLAYRLLVQPNTKGGELRKADFRMLLLSLTVLGSSVVLSIFVDAIGVPEAVVICRLYAAVACTLGLVMQFSISHSNRLETDNQILEYMLRQEKQQHEMAKENIDIINIKCHDLKYQIAQLEAIDDRAQRQDSIRELEQSVMIYDSMAETGCDALDLVLTEKSLICEKHKIKFSSMVDGARLNFLAASDIYALFGNALDNAIESVCKAEEDRRIISLKVSAEKQMLFIHLDNYCAEPPKFVEEFPVTTKDNDLFHGFGTRSIRYIVQCYHGDVKMSWSDHFFHLDILFCME